MFLDHWKFDYIMSQFWTYILRLHHWRILLFYLVHLPYNVTAMQIWFKDTISGNILEDCRIWQTVCNGLILCIHLRSEFCRIWLFNFVYTSKNMIIKIYKNIKRVFIHICRISWFNFFMVRFSLFTWKKNIVECVNSIILWIIVRTLSNVLRNKPTCYV